MVKEKKNPSIEAASSLAQLYITTGRQRVRNHCLTSWPNPGVLGLSPLRWPGLGLAVRIPALPFVQPLTWAHGQRTCHTNPPPQPSGAAQCLTSGRRPRPSQTFRYFGTSAGQSTVSVPEAEQMVAVQRIRIRAPGKVRSRLCEGIYDMARSRLPSSGLKWDMIPTLSYFLSFFSLS